MFLVSKGFNLFVSCSLSLADEWGNQLVYPPPVSVLFVVAGNFEVARFISSFFGRTHASLRRLVTRPYSEIYTMTTIATMTTILASYPNHHHQDHLSPHRWERPSEGLQSSASSDSHCWRPSCAKKSSMKNSITVYYRIAVFSIVPDWGRAWGGQGHVKKCCKFVKAF